MIHTPTATAPVPNSSGRLKYADPRDLPSYPSSGLPPDGAAASAAASLGWSNQKSIELWKPDKSSSASAAAAMAKDYKMAPAWEPTSNSAGQKAALLALGSAAARTSSQRSSQEGWVSSAATQAFNTNRSNTARHLHQTTSASSLQGQKSLAAAKGAMSTTRRRAKSSPSAPAGHESVQGDSVPRSLDAVSGAALAHRASLRSKPSTESPGAVPITTMSRSMFTSHPPVKPEVDERQNNERLHATAVAMARKMYTQQQKIIDEAKERQGQGSDEAQTKAHINLQDAAYKQAQERLAKLQDEHQKNKDLQAYYGSAPSHRHRFSLTSKLRRRSSSDGDLDRQQSEKIRQQMSLFSNKLSEVDEKKRQQDRDALLAAAQRNVKARLQGMDQKVYHETGQVNPTLLSEWELKAHQAASASHESRTAHQGKVDIGGGRFMDPTEVDAIAAQRVQPVLDNINDKAKAERERLATLKLEEEAKKAEQEKQRAQDRRVKEMQRKIKEQEKQDIKARKAEDKAAKAEEKRQAKEEKRRSKGDTALPVPAAANDSVSSHSEEPRLAPELAMAERPITPVIETDTSNLDYEQQKTSDPGLSPTSKVKGWIRQHFSRGKVLSDKDSDKGEKRRSFLGGAALRDSELNRSATSLDSRQSSMRDMALVGRGLEVRAADRDAAPRDSRGVSPVSTLRDEGTENGREYVITPPPPIEEPALRDSHSPSRDSRFREMVE